jgi:NAD(P)-dependent dehydrogenase (short-subunit alcohol dehydrogenase family)
MAGELEGKRALVTGSSAGIGEGIARLFAAEGARVFIHGRDAARAARIAGELGSAWATGNLRDADESAALVQAVEAALGGVDILVNNAGGLVGAGASGSAFDDPPETWMETYNANWISALRLIQAFLPGMKARGWGRIIQIASGSAYSPQAGVADYGAAKAGMVNATLGLARALARTGVTSNVISPGVIVTEKAKGWLMGLASEKGWSGDWPEVEKRIAVEMMPTLAGRLGRPLDIARAALFLASPAADFVTGSEMRIDGGRLG